jgi:long-chain acyl-CoA synthetase
VEKTGLNLKNIIVAGIGDYLPGTRKFIGRSVLGTIWRKMEIPKVEIPKRNNIFSFQNLLEKGQKNPPAVDINPMEDLAVLLYTAGTTDTARGVMMTHHNLFAAQAIADTFWSHGFGKGRNLEEGNETVIASLPFDHIYGQVLILLGGLLHGYTLVLLTTPDIDDVFKSAGKYGVTFLVGEPGLYGLLTNYKKTDRLDWNRLKLVLSVTDSLSEEVVKNWERRTGIPIHEGYGLTETGPAICFNPSGRSKVGSFGVPLPNTMVAVVHPDKAEFMPQGEIGELAVKGPQVMKGYWRNEAETDLGFVQIMGETWLRTGDLASIDDEGYFYFHDRKRDLIIHDNHPVFPGEIEEVLKTHPKVREAAVIGIPDEKGGVTIKAVIVLQSGARGKLSEEEIVSYCQERLADYKIPTMIEFRGEIPKTDVGKVSRRELREGREA